MFLTCGPLKESKFEKYLNFFFKKKIWEQHILETFGIENFDKVWTLGSDWKVVNSPILLPNSIVSTFSTSFKTFSTSNSSSTSASGLICRVRFYCFVISCATRQRKSYRTETDHFVVEKKKFVIAKQPSLHFVSHGLVWEKCFPLL